MKNSKTILLQLVDFYSVLTYDKLPAPVIDRTRRLLIDFLIELAVAPRDSELITAYLGYLNALSDSNEATILGSPNKQRASESAMVMGILAHSIELDDGHRWGTAHPAVAIIPASLAMGEKLGSSFKEILNSIVIGYDLMLRVARSINPSHLKRGFHSTGTCGTIGAAAACASLMKLPFETFAYAISIGALQSSGIQEMLHDHPGVKPLQAGNAARAGILAAELASRGVKAPRSLFEGEHGWLKAMCDGEYQLDALISNLGVKFEVMFTYTKLYPTCRHCHATIDLVRDAKSQLKFSPKDIENIKVITYSLGVAEVGSIRIPRDKEEAMFSLPFAVAITSIKGHLKLSDFTEEKFKDLQIQELAKLVEIEVDINMDRNYPNQRGARLVLTLNDGRKYDNFISVPKGEPENPVTDEELYDKFKSMLVNDGQERLLDDLWNTIILKKVDEVKYYDVIKIFNGAD